MLIKKDFSVDHIPVFVDEILHYVAPTISYAVDLTLGAGGHAFSLFAHCPQVFLYGVDRDTKSSRYFMPILSEYQDRFFWLQENFADAVISLQEEKVCADFIYADLGMSSMQLTEAERGFSFLGEGVLDMRMDQRQVLTAQRVVNSYPERELVRIFSEYGEEHMSKTLARRIVARRKEQPFTTTTELASFIVQYKPRVPTIKIHPATKIFQALRIEVNQELQSLTTMLKNVLSILAPQGRMAIISFHSLEDRIVKHQFQEWSNPCNCGMKADYCTCGKKPQVKILTKKPLIPTEKEKLCNPRSRSAKLRIIEKL